MTAKRSAAALPNFEAALASGAVSAGHVDAIAAAVRDMDQVTAAEFFTHRDDLLAKAGEHSVDTFGRSCRDLPRLVARRAGRRVRAVRVGAPAGGVQDHTLDRQGDRDAQDPARVGPRTRQDLVDRRLGQLEEAAPTPRTRQDPVAQLEVEALLAACNGGDGAQRVPALIVLADIDTLRSGCMPTRSAKPTTAHRCPSRSCAAWPATPRSSPSSSTARPSARGRALATVGDTGPTRGAGGDAPDLHRTDLHRSVRGLPDPPK